MSLDIYRVRRSRAYTYVRYVDLFLAICISTSMPEFGSLRLWCSDQHAMVREVERDQCEESHLDKPRPRRCTNPQCATKSAPYLPFRALSFETRLAHHDVVADGGASSLFQKQHKCSEIHRAAVRGLHCFVLLPLAQRGESREGASSTSSCKS